MAINNVSNSTTTNQTSSSDSVANATAGANQLGADDFMKLLVAQLKNQDPNNPLDTKDLVTQLSQLSGVEQLVTMGQHIQDLESTTQGMAANQSAGLIGKSVAGTNDSVVLKSTGSASSAVNLGQGANKVTVSIRNDAGNVVRTFDLTNKTAGSQVITWDGMMDNEQRATAGTYTVEVDAKDKAGNPVAADMTVSGIVTGVSYDDGPPELIVGNTRLPLSKVSSISQ